VAVLTPTVPPPAAWVPGVPEIKSWSRRDFTDLDAPFTDSDLQVRLDRSIAYLEAVTGRKWDGSMPPVLVPIAQEATQLRVEQMCFQEQEDYYETTNDDQIQSFTAGNYSENRPIIRTYTGTSSGFPEVNTNGWLNKDIWLLCTDDMRTYWIETLQGAAMAAQIPSMEVTEADWGNYGGLYPYSWGPGAFRTPLLDNTVWGA